MDADRFDALARSLTRSRSRRSLARLLGGVSLGGVLTALQSGDATAACKPPGTQCTAATKTSCCSGRCLASGKCACAASPAGAKCKQPPAGSCKKVVCDAGVCKPRPTPGAACNDGKDCTVEDVCTDKVGQCRGTPKHGRCSSDDLCAVGRCRPMDPAADARGCVSVAINGGEPCPGDTVCGGAQGCVCPTDKPDLCGDACVDTRTDANNCGQCGGGPCVDQGAASCGTTGRCVGGSCETYGPETQCAPALCASDTTSRPARFCTGSGTCPAPTTVGCGAYRCNIGTGTCFTSCAGPAQCRADAYCASDTCQLKKFNGSTCSQPVECLSGFCADGFCCDQSCSDPCQACSTARKGSGPNGVCANLPDGTPCNNGNVCNGGVCPIVK